MALSGLIYPIPVWLVGFLIWLLSAAVAVWSKLWTPLDKVAGIIGQVALVIVGTATAFSLGGTRASVHAYVHEALADSMYLIKLGALLGAGFLAWRAHCDHRAPDEPPWARRHRR